MASVAKKQPRNNNQTLLNITEESGKNINPNNVSEHKLVEIRAVFN